MNLKDKRLWGGFLILSILILFSIWSWNYQLENSLTEKCEDLKNQIEKQVEKMNHCNNDADCTIYQLGCPFDCGNYVNKDSDTNSIKKLVDSYRINCENCEYKCMRPPEPICLNGKCMGTQCEIGEELENSFECECPEGTEFSHYHNYSKEKWVYRCISLDLKSKCCEECINAFNEGDVGTPGARCDKLSTVNPLSNECELYFDSNPMDVYTCE